MCIGSVSEAAAAAAAPARPGAGVLVKQEGGQVYISGRARAKVESSTRLSRSLNDCDGEMDSSQGQKKKLGSKRFSAASGGSSSTGSSSTGPSFI